MKYKKFLIYGTLAVLAILTIAVIGHSGNLYSGMFMD